MVTIREAVSNLNVLAEKLNKGTDDLNAVIEGVDSKLGTFRVGVSIWHDLLLCCDRSEHEDRGWFVGYTKVGEGWHLAAKPVRIFEKPIQHEAFPGGTCTVTEATGPIVKLTSAPRMVRIEAAPLLVVIVDMLCKKVEEFLRDIEETKALIK